MNKEAVLHMPLSQYAYAEDEHKLTIRIRCAKNDIRECRLFYGDRVDMQEPVRTTELVMEKVASDDLYDYFEADIEDRYTRVCYYFRLDDGEIKEYFYSRGFCKRLQAHRTEYFQFPYIRREDITDIPGWAKDLVMYHIFPDSFASGKRAISCETKRVADETGLVSEGHNGGTLRGIIENLDYIKALGVNCIYLNPIFRANSYHKYDTIDYFDIDPCFGTKADLRELVESCHLSGIRVILDGVFNHCGPDFVAFREVLARGGDSEYYDWFYSMPLPVEYQNPPNYEAFAYVREMPKLNTGNPEVAEYFCRVGAYWIREADIDGWRLDVANEIDHDFWRAFRKAVRKEKKDCFLIAEIWEEAGVWLMGDQFDSTMNYTFSYLCRDLFAEDKISITEFDQQIHKMLMRYAWRTDLCQMNFLDTHDVPRFLSYCDGDVKRLRLAVLYMMTAVGIPSVFYGDEMEIQGVQEPEYRSPMPWEREKEESALIAFYQKLIRLRRDNEAIRTGRYRTIMADDKKRVYLYERYTENQSAYVLINLGSAGVRRKDFLKESLSLSDEEVIEPMEGKIFLVDK
ncbi:MAG: alpha-glycosidase [Lachnospiraceae bacterium]|nr:alpha-glycosidase [Lachnospiraceae bacterium]